MQYVHTLFPSSVGTLTLVAGVRGLAGILWEQEKAARVPYPEHLTEDKAHPVLRETARQLEEYFAGKRQVFDMPLDFTGNDFQRGVWAALLDIPYGETRSYGQIAARVGNPKAVRAVGAAIGKNPVSIIAPCHRVVGANGKLTGFAGGLPAKAFLLDLEAAAAHTFHQAA